MLSIYVWTSIFQFRISAEVSDSGMNGWTFACQQNKSQVRAILPGVIVDIIPQDAFEFCQLLLDDKI